MPDQSRRILVVDDSPHLCGFLELLLRSEGYDVQSANSLDEADALLAGWLPDALIADVRLPGSPPFAILDLLKTRDATRSLPVLLCSGAVNEIQGAAERLQREQIPVLPKPFELDTLTEMLSALLERESAAQAEAATASDPVAL